MESEQHAADEFCFFCAPDATLENAVGAALDSAPHVGPKIHWQVPESFCPAMVDGSDDR